MDTTEYATLTSAADSAGVPASTLRHWIESGRLPATSSERGRLVRLADVQQLVASSPAPLPGTGSGQLPATGPAALPAAEHGPLPTAVVTAPSDTSLAVSPQPPRAPVRRRRQATSANVAAFMAKLDELYRVQIAAKDGEIAAKDELIAELRRRAERAEQQTAMLEQKLAAGQAQLEAVRVQAAAPRSGLLARLFTRYARQ